jgi:Tol biopolymer transport system component
MKTTRIGLAAIVGLTLVLTILTVAPTPALAQTGSDLFQQALVKEQAEGDLQGAIALYERIVRDFSGDRTLSANALVQIGQCYERLGSQEAERAYQRVVQDYPEQTEIVTRARARLAELRRPPARSEGSAIVLRQIPADDGFMDGGALRDGRSFVYVDYATGDVAVQDLVSGKSRRLTHEGTWESPAQYAINVSASADGKWAAYTWERQLDSASSVIELRVVGMDGSPPRVLCSNTDGVGYPMSWSSDGRHVAVWAFDSVDHTGSIAWVSVSDGTMRRLATFPGWEWASLSHSPDDRFVVAEYPVAEDSGRYDLFLVATGGGGAIPLVDHPANDRLLGWLPGTDDVLFLSDRSGDWDLWAIDVEDGRASGAPVALKRGVGNIEALGFTDAGSMVFYDYTLRWATSIAPFDPATGHLDATAGEPLLGSLSRGAWSPSGGHLAFVRQTTGPGGPGWLDSRLVVRNLATGEERTLASHLDPIVPRWFPDEQSILLAAKERRRPSSGGPGLYRIDVSTGDAALLVEPAMGDAAWVGGILAKMGDGLIYARDGRLVLRDLSSGGDTELYQEAGLATNLFAVSPDGDEVVFAVSDPPGQGEVLVGAGKLLAARLEGGSVRELSRVRGPGRVNTMQWTPDGRHVLFLQSRGDKGATLWRVPSAGGEAEELWQTKDRMTWFALSPDGSQAVYTTVEGDSEVWVMENLKEALKANDGSESTRGTSTSGSGS